MPTHVMAYPTGAPSPHPTLYLMALILIPTEGHQHHPDWQGKAASKLTLSSGNQTWGQPGACQSCGTLTETNNLEHSNKFSSGLLHFMDANCYRQWDHLKKTLNFSHVPRRDFCSTNNAAIHVRWGCRIYKSSCNSSFWFGPGQHNP